MQPAATVHSSAPGAQSAELIEARKFRYLGLLAWLVMAASGVVLVSNFSSGLTGLNAVAGPGTGLAGSAGALWALRAGRRRLAGVLLMIAALLWATWGAAITGGARSILVGAFITIGALSGWLLGVRYMVAIMSASLAAMIGLVLFQGSDLLPPMLAENKQRVIVGLVVVFSLTSFLLYMVFRESEAQIVALQRAQAAHVAGEAHFELIASNVPAMLSHWDRDLRCLWTNRHYADFIGRPADAIIGRHLTELFTPDALKDVMPRLERVLSGEEAIYERPFALADGSTGVLAGHLVPARGPDGAVDGWFGLLQDVTEERRRERLIESLAAGTARARGTEFFRILARQLAQAFGVRYAMVAELTGAGRCARSLAFWNDGDYAPDFTYDLAGAPCRIVAEKGEAYFGEQVAQMFPEDKALAAKGIEGYCGVALRAAAGETLGVLVVMDNRPLRRTAEMASVMEIFANRAAAELERQRAEASLVESEQRFRGMTLLSSDWYWEVDAELRFTLASGKGLETFGLTPDMLLGRSSLSLGKFERLRPNAEEYARVRRERLPYRDNISRARMPDGTWGYISVSGEPQFDAEGQFRGYRGVTRNITVQMRAEEQLRASQARFAGLFESSPTPVSVVRAEDGRLLEVNPAWLEHFGYLRERVIGHDSAEFGMYEEADLADRDRVYAAIQSQGFVDGMEINFRHASGEPRPCLVSGRIFESEGERLAIWGFADIRAQRAAAAALKESAERSRLAVDLARLVYWEWDRTSDRVRWGSGDATHEATDGGDCAWTEYRDRVHAEDRARYVAEVNAAWEGHSAFASEYRVVGRSGRARWIAVQAKPVFDGGGDPLRMIGVSQDITERKLAEEGLRASQRLLETVVDAIPMAIFAKDRNSNYVMVNKYSAEFFGTTKEALLKRHHSQLPVSDASMRKALEDDEWVFRHRRSRDIPEMLIERPDGTPVPFQVSKIPLFDGAGELVGLLGINRDISEDRRAQEALRESEQRFAAIFRDAPTPLSLNDAADGRFLDANPAWLGLLGYSREQVIGRHSAEIGLYRDPTDRDRLYGALARAGFVERMEIAFRRPDEGICLCIVSGRTIETAGRQMVVFGLSDVTEQRRAQQEILESEERFRQIFDNASDAMWLVAVQPGGRLEYQMTNRTHANMTGLDPARIRGKTPQEAHPGRNDDYVDQRWRACLAAGDVMQYEEELQLQSGLRTWHTSLVPVRDAGGTICRIVGIGHDITERKKVENELRASEERFTAIFQDSPAPLAVVNVEDGRFGDVNRAWSELFGFTREQAVGRAASEFALVRNPDERRELYATLMRDGYVERREFTATAAGGEDRITLVSGRLVDLGGERSVLWSFVDVTELRRAQRALQESEKRFAAMFHDSPAALAVIEPDGRYRTVNRAWLALLGYTRMQVVGRNSSEFDLFAQPDGRKALYDLLERDASVDRFEVGFRRADGTALTCLVSGRAVELDGTRTYLWGVVDVSEQRRAQRQMQELNLTLERSVAQRTEALTRSNVELQSTLDTLRSAQEQLLQSEKMAALGRLVAGVAHELNTPIGNGLLVATALKDESEAFAALAAKGLRRSALDAFVTQSQEAAEMLTRSLEKAAQLIASFKQVAADQTSSQRRSFNLREVLDEVLLTHHSMLRKASVGVEAKVPADILMDSYPGPLGQVLSNLLSNAVMHAHEGRERGSVVISALAREDERIEITVRDDGHGIPEDSLRRVFDPFYTTKLGRGGTGLGLAICHNIVTQALGGEIRIESAPGQGTAVRIDLPRIAPQTGAVDLSAPVAAGLTGTG